MAMFLYGSHLLTNVLSLVNIFFKIAEKHPLVPAIYFEISGKFGTSSRIVYDCQFDVK